jgi:hypothetical protein
MGTAPTPVLVSAYGTGNSSDGKITRDAIDDLIGAMSSHLLLYMRSVKINTVPAHFSDALGNSLTCNNTGQCSYTAVDTNFNNHSSITFSQTGGGSAMYTASAGGIGTGTPPVAMTNSFTIMAGIHAGNASGGNSLYGDNAGTSDSANLTGLYLSSAGNIAGVIGTPNLSFSGTQPLLSPGNTGVVWISYDSVTNIVRAGSNNGTVQLTSTSSVTRTGAGTGTVCYPFSYKTGGQAGNQSFNRWTLWNKAFMNGAVQADDAAFVNLVTSYATYI